MAKSSKTISGMTDKISPPVSFIDHEGNCRSFRVFSKNGCEGVCNLKADSIELPSIFGKAEISSYYEAFLVKDSHNRWISEGTIPMYREILLKKAEESSQRTRPKFIKKLVQKGFYFMCMAINKVDSSNVTQNAYKVWRAFSLDGKPLFNGRRFSYNELRKRLKARVKEMDNWYPNLEGLSLATNWRFIVENSKSF